MHKVANLRSLDRRFESYPSRLSINLTILCKLFTAHVLLLPNSRRWYWSNVGDTCGWKGNHRPDDSTGTGSWLLSLWLVTCGLSAEGWNQLWNPDAQWTTMRLRLSTKTWHLFMSFIYNIACNRWQVCNVLSLDDLMENEIIQLLYFKVTILLSK